MNSERIKTIAKFINPQDIVLDVGCDHGYLDIYLKQNNLCKEVYASDISQNALNSAIKNFQKYHVDIDTFQSDGLKDIKVSFNTAVLAGMGTSTILDILNNPKCPNKLILASNNNLKELRMAINKLGYRLDREEVIYEKGHYYSVMLYLKGKEKLSNKEKLFGKSHNKEYWQYLYSKNKEIIKKVPLSKKFILWKENKILKGLIEKK